VEVLEEFYHQQEHLEQIRYLVASLLLVVVAAQQNLAAAQVAQVVREEAAPDLRPAPQALVYGSTSGVYGDCGGARIDETRTLAAHTPRAQRRVDAEAQVRFYGRHAGVPAHILRIPGIYAPNREGGTPRGRLLKGTPVLREQDDVYTNHIHADDLARACIAALWRGRPQRVTTVCDQTELKMGDYFDTVADACSLPRPPRLPMSELKLRVSPMMLSFMNESRRLHNQRMKQELRLRLRYPDVHAVLRLL
jgi:nucleoside-diphosphate-sugar epimerase